MKKRWLVAGGIAAAAATGMVLCSEAAFSIVSRRKSALFRLAQGMQNDLTAPPPERAQELADSIAALRDKELEKFTTKSHDGLTLTAHWYPAENPKRTVILFHGWRSSWYHDFGMSSEFLHENGCNLLYVEQRGHGGSEGEYISYGILERYDVQTWVDFMLGRNTENLPIYLCGISMGASTVLMATELPLKHTVHGIIADCGYTSGDAIIKNLVGRNAKHLPVGAVYKMTDRVCKRHTGFAYEDYSTVTALKNNIVPILFIHGEDDEFVPASMTMENYEACAGPKELFIVPKAVHGTSYAVDMEGYQSRVLAFFEKYD